MKLILIISIVILALGSCYNKTNDIKEQDLIVESLMEVAFDSLSQRYDFTNKFLVHSGMYPDIIKTESIERLRQHFKSSLPKYSEELKLLSALGKIANDTVKISKGEINLVDLKLLFVFNDSVFQNKHYFGSFSMTNPAFNESRDKCTFYLAINCGNHCSSGYVFFADRNSSNKWIIVKRFEIWGDN